MSRYDTIVIGLGSAGATAASTLAKAGKRVLALEAQDRVGGRVHTVQFGDGVVELGAEWIHGTDTSPVYEAAVRNNIALLKQEYDESVYKSDGTLGDSVILEMIYFCLQTMNTSPEEPEPLGKYITRKLTAYLEEKYPNILNDTEFMKEFLEIADIVVDGNEGSNNWNDASSNRKYVPLGGSQDMSWRRHGYKTFFDILLNKYKNGPGWPTLDIKLNKEVKLIKWPRDSSGDVEVTCADGSVFTADNVIVTVSLGVLKERHQALFSPALPDDKVTAIEKIPIGVVGKIILSFSERWWPEKAAYIFHWLKPDKEKYEKWQVGLKDISAIKGSDNTLKIWTIGEATKLIETLPEDVVKAKSMEVVRMFLGKNMTIPEPTGVIRTTWFSNPFTRGCYSYDNLLMAKHPSARADLGAPLTDSEGVLRVLFAGEATHPTQYSTVHGASNSGYREATRLLSAENK
ncbi:uncharacterized protein LOC133319873 isoform X2 [Danaus plexippus]|nr:uncharacterized protein LOC133319873 isoform X2 [Danaus plexippus]XP_061381831.1 uncharacterized protein LOC133319873 isoform X2 [Danaus plexippus]XP_061381832.1 uncharacterized protein LOC133319873 isoform X2 [Danaus plexippus]XP_061381833.1 uncharacterized protein LOC133319873 isoform X2 [Danaus plexippus]